jgi:hypothetical protein
MIYETIQDNWSIDFEMEIFLESPTSNGRHVLPLSIPGNEK